MGHTPAVTRSSHHFHQWAQPALDSACPLSLLTWAGHWCQQLLAGSHAGYTVQEEWLWAPAAAQLLQGTAAAKSGAWQRVAQDWSQICPNGAVGRVWRGNATLFSSSECDCSSSISGYGRAHIPDRAGTGTQQTLLSFCSSCSGRAAQWELGLHHGWKDPPSAPTKPPLHTQPLCARHRECEGLTNPLPQSPTRQRVLVASQAPLCWHRTTWWQYADQYPLVLEEPN